MSRIVTYSSEEYLRHMIPRGEGVRYATIIGVFSCVMIEASLLAPWYQVDYFFNSTFDHRELFFVGIAGGMGSLMTKVAIVVVLSLIAAVIATLLSYLRMRVPGVAVAALSAGSLALAIVLFVQGVVKELSLSSFEGFSLLNRSVAVTTQPMLGWWIAAAGVFVLSAQAVVLAISHSPEGAKEEPSIPHE